MGLSSLAQVLLLATLVAYVPTSSCLNLVKKSSSPAVLGAKISRQAASVDILERDRRRRQAQRARFGGSTANANTKRQADTVDVDLRNEVSLYVIEVDIGTPSPQRVGLHIDTGSSDMWVNIPTSRICRKYTRYCEVLGTFDPTESSTFSLVNNDFSIKYADGSTAAGSYVTDTVAVSGISLRSLQFAIANKSTTSDGVLGVGYRLNEASGQYGRDELYQNLPAKLAGRGLINSNAYSLWLNDLEASTGEILFGGVNQAKYTGSLRTLPVLPTHGFYTHFFIALTDIGLNGNVGSLADNVAIPVLLDSGTTLTYLPNDIANALFEIYGAEYYPNSGSAGIPCSAGNRDATVEFTFSGLTISIPLSELVISAGRGSSTCAFGITRAYDSISVLGDTFLRSAYVVYDLDNNEVSLAQTAVGASGNDIVEITSGADAVPGAQDVPNPTAITIGFSPTPILGGTGGTGGSRGTDDDSSGGAAGSLLTVVVWTLACAGVGVAVLVTI